ncbi:hypothetical protein Cni_G20071 [Canna indica]|uniref:Terpene synthase metal-binding domain-containing protein n=1 Tax=Canna indica TaxID=4628 RepID=A0AAQ3QHG7_9LILI|nr:hypothetical protein Cni_G20071 [Canna indica]
MAATPPLTLKHSYRCVTSLQQFYRGGPFAVSNDGACSRAPAGEQTKRSVFGTKMVDFAHISSKLVKCCSDYHPPLLTQMELISIAKNYSKVWRFFLYNIGARLIDEFLSKSNVSKCIDFKEKADVIAKYGLLLEFAKLDFNMLQDIHKKELSDLSRWWTDLGLPQKLPFFRDRLMENYLWSVGSAYEAEHWSFRDIQTKANCFITMIDDVYDVHGTLDVLELFTDAFDRWDVNAIDKLPEYIYEALSSSLQYI